MYKTKHVSKVGETFPHLIQKCETLQRHKFTISDYSEPPCMTACPQFFKQDTCCGANSLFLLI